jgi:hypothetical protein
MKKFCFQQCSTLAKRLDGWQERQTERTDEIADFKDRSGWAMDELTERQKLVFLNWGAFA